ncbi:hypothetical protein PENTCL1PPCAC_5784, partial [Pristionchus entomophagus]
PEWLLAPLRITTPIPPWMRRRKIRMDLPRRNLEARPPPLRDSPRWVSPRTRNSRRPSSPHSTRMYRTVTHHRTRSTDALSTLHTLC